MIRSEAPSWTRRHGVKARLTKETTDKLRTCGAVGVAVVNDGIREPFGGRQRVLDELEDHGLRSLEAEETTQVSQ